jgi:hypothetical protein
MRSQIVLAKSGPERRGRETREVRKSLQRNEADDGTRTHDTWLGKPVLYQLSYVRAGWILAPSCVSAFLPIPRFMLIDLSSAQRASIGLRSHLPYR